jgi:hypothetical protein
VTETMKFVGGSRSLSHVTRQLAAMGNIIELRVRTAKSTINVDADEVESQIQVFVLQFISYRQNVLP